MTERIRVSAVEREDAPDMPSWVLEESTTYAQAGVDTAEGARAVEAIKEAVHETYRDEVIGDIGGFGGLFSLAAAKTMDDPILVSGTDGVGTKLKLAQIVGKHDTVGIDLVAMCANDILASGAEPLFFLDYIAVGKLQADEVAKIVTGIAEGCKRAGCALIGGEMAEHPGVMKNDEYDLSGFCVGLVDRAAMLTRDAVSEGDVLLGLASSGLHSNGYSLVRKVCVEGKTLYELRLKRAELKGQSIEEALLTPTRIYVKPVRALLKRFGKAIHSLAHITGGGISENLNRILPDTLNAEVELGAWEVPPVASFVCKAARLDETEALKTFNMGLGMIVAVSSDKAADVKAAFEEEGERVFEIGRVGAGDGSVVYHNKGSLYACPSPESDEELEEPKVVSAPAERVDVRLDDDEIF